MRNKIKKYILIFSPLVILVIIFVTFYLSTKRNQKLPVSNNIIITMPTTIPIVLQKSLSVIDTSPVDNAINVPTGEIEISFTTNKEIPSANTLNMTITPNLPYYWKMENSYPTKEVVAKVYGGLNTNTTYTVSIKDSSGEQMYSWSFTTSNQIANSSSALVHDWENSFKKKYQPLIDYTPYQTSDFETWYTGKLALIVQVKNPNIALVQKEVDDWIKSHGVDPSTHTINYVKDY